MFAVSIIAELWDSLVVKVIVAIISPTLIALLYFLFRRLHRAFEAHRFADAALEAVARRQENGLFLLRHIFLV